MTYSIGEVLNQLKDEFDDVTISKIRFLEAEGLISPDRTDSGYRQFLDDDVDRLRYILRAQRDRYLPLKVIREELDRIDAGVPVDADVPSDDASGPPGPAPAAADDPPPLLAADTGDVSLSFAELADVAGLEPGDLHALRDHGVIADADRFDGRDLRAARAAGALMEAGLEARHLRMFRQFADRELALIEQLVTPLLRQRNPDSRVAATELANGIAHEGAALRRALLERQVAALLRS
ncbi:MAG: MerR family transcriptional regulator [Nitriliruptorales bacterium]|nr:MerR family transcriptional regulator [Nitriliruptorales bacterium]